MTRFYTLIALAALLLPGAAQAQWSPEVGLQTFEWPELVINSGAPPATINNFTFNYPPEYVLPDTSATLIIGYTVFYRVPTVGDTVSMGTYYTLTGVTGNAAYGDDGLGDVDGCDPLPPFPPNTIAFIERAGESTTEPAVLCGFGRKAFHAQQAGAIGVVIFNNADRPPPETVGGMLYPSPPEEYGPINIPVVLIPRSMALPLLAALDAGTPLNVTIRRADESVAIEPGGPLTGTSEVFDARPNPFSVSTEFGVRLAETEVVRVEVFNSIGQRVAMLHDGALAPQSVHEFSLEASALPSGVYLYRITGESFVETRSVVLAR